MTRAEINAAARQRRASLLALQARCGKCNRPFKPKEPVWRWRAGPGHWSNHQWVPSFISTCKACYREHATWRDDDTGKTYELDSSRVKQTGKCAACGRKVHQTDWLNYRYFYCSELCRQKHQPGFQAALTREARARKRGASRVCAQCGKQFAPKRNDARFCSAPCKQKAYRKRVTANKKPRAGRIGTRNAVTANKKRADPGIANRNARKRP
jgi:endogenous inhibitor of DNA gyrase (YacG/DUF329 family)